MNVLVANVSTFSNNTVEREYAIEVDNCSVKTINAKHTNESILKCVVKLNEVICSGGIQKVIALASNKSLLFKDTKNGDITAFDYYLSVIRETAENAEVIVVPIESETGIARSMGEIIFDVCNHIKFDDKVYIDSAGGMRTTTNVIQLLTKLMKYAGIKNPLTLYSDIQNQPVICDTQSFVQMTALADAFNEFMTTGMSEQLLSCCKTNELDPAFHLLLDAMNEFSDRIRLNNVDAIEQVVKKLKQAIAKCKEIETNHSIESVIIQQFLPVIEKKLLSDDEEHIDYLQLVNWCLDNALIQQALTLFIDKIPVLLYEKKVFEYKHNLKEKKEVWQKQKGNIKHCDWACDAFYTDLLCVKTEVDTLLDEFKDCVKLGTKSNVQTINDAVRTIYSFNNPRLKSSRTDELAKLLKKHIIEKNFTGYPQFINGICNDVPLMKKILVINEEKAENSPEQAFANKFNALAIISKTRKINDDYKLNIPIERFVDVMYGYIYAKAMRNQISHASSEGNLADDQKHILTSKGFCFSDDSLRTVRKNIYHAVYTVQDAITNMSPHPVVEQIENLMPTELKIGDEVDACYRGNKIVHIAPYQYDIQLVLPKYEPFEYNADDILRVRIKQISNNGIINQVELYKTNTDK